MSSVFLPDGNTAFIPADKSRGLSPCFGNNLRLSIQIMNPVYYP